MILSDSEIEAEKKKKEENLRIAIFRGDMNQVLESPSGRRVLWAFLERFGVFRQTFQNDPHATAFNEGRRSAGNDLLSAIEDAKQEALFTMMHEAKAERDRMKDKHDKEGQQ